MSEDDLLMVRRAAARRVHQGVSLESLLHAYRLWGQIVWGEILAATRPQDPAEREGALELAGRVIQHINVASTVTGRAYLDEMQGVWTDREALQRDLLDELISGKGHKERVVRLAEALDLHLGDRYFVVVARPAELWQADPELRPLANRRMMRKALEACRSHLAPGEGSLIAGIRHEELVALYPADPPHHGDAARAQWERFAAAVAPHGFAVGVGGPHPELAGVAAGYLEAREAVRFAGELDMPRAPVFFEDVLVDHLLQSSPLSGRLTAGALGALQAYDARKGSKLVETLRAYRDSGFNITKTASALCIHPNTVVYRLRRIKELSGRDPSDPEDLLLLCLALRILDGRGAPATPRLEPGPGP